METSLPTVRRQKPERIYVSLAISITIALILLFTLRFSNAAADTTTNITVTSSDVGTSWFSGSPADTRSGGAVSFISGPATAPLGAGSLQMTTTDAYGTSQAKAQLFNYSYIGTPLANIDALSYSAYKSSTSTNSAAQTMGLNMEIDAGDGAGFTTLVYEPVYQPAGVGAIATDTWQTWNAFNGGNGIWWSTHTIPGVCAFTCYVSWSTIVAHNHNATVLGGLGFNVGSGWVGQFSGNADALTVGVSGNTKIYDFEPNTVRLVDHTGQGLPGGTASYYSSGWHTIPGTTDANGYLVLPPSITFSDIAMVYNGERLQQTLAQVTASNFTFQTTQVTVQLKASDGNPLDTGTASYYATGWHTIGATSSGQVQLEMLPGSYSFAMVYNGERQQLDSQNIATTPTVVFQTKLVTVQLKDADGNPLDTGSASDFASGWHTIGVTSGGQVQLEMLPGIYSFVMNYNGGRQQLDGQNIEVNQVVVFQTGRLSLYYSGGISWYFGGWYTFNKPTMEFLPGTPTFYFDGYGCQAPIAITSGDHLVESMVSATLSNHSGTKVAGGDASAYVSGWKPIGTTNGYGTACKLFDGQLGNVSVAMTYGGTHQQITQNQPTNSVYGFQTDLVTLQLKNSSDALIDTGTGSYYASGWHSLGNTSGGQITLEMLPGTYSFAMVYNGERNQVSQNISADPTVVFQTDLVTLQLKNSSDALIDTGTGSYYASGWHNLGNTSGGQITLEMLPGTYSFAMVYNGERNQVSQNISADPTVVFQTNLVTIKLEDHNGGPLANGTASYYASGWRSIGDTDGTGRVQLEMLPGTYSFAMTYLGSREQLNGQNVASDVVFQTGQVISDGGTATNYYASGWKPFTSGIELLPGTYTFSFNDQPNATGIVTAGATTTIH